MKKYMMLALLPILFQGSLYCADLNKAIQQQLISARRVMDNVKIPLELEVVLVALITNVATGKINKFVAIDKIKAIKAALEQYKSEQYTMWSRWFGLNSEIVKNQIDPAILKVNVTLNALNAQLTNYNYEIAGTIVGLGLTTLIGIGALYVRYLANVSTHSAVAKTPGSFHIGPDALPSHMAVSPARDDLEARLVPEVNADWKDVDSANNNSLGAAARLYSIMNGDVEYSPHLINSYISAHDAAAMPLPSSPTSDDDLDAFFHPFQSFTGFRIKKINTHPVALYENPPFQLK